MSRLVTAGLVLGVMALAWFAYIQGCDITEEHWQQRWAQRDRDDVSATLAREKAERERERDNQRKADEERKRANEALAKLERDRAAADGAAVGLRYELRKLRRQTADSETGRITAATSAVQAKNQARLLLAELLGEADDLAGKYAAEADRAYAAGSSCERSYDAITEVKH